MKIHLETKPQFPFSVVQTQTTHARGPGVAAGSPLAPTDRPTDLPTGLTWQVARLSWFDSSDDDDDARTDGVAVFAVYA